MSEKLTNIVDIQGLAIIIPFIIMISTIVIASKFIRVRIAFYIGIMMFLISFSIAYTVIQKVFGNITIF